MPYIILIIGVLVGLYGLYRFFMVANVHQIRAMTMTAILLTMCGAMLLMSLTGRLPAALAILIAGIPFIIAYRKNKKHLPQKPDDSKLDDSEEE